MKRINYYRLTFLCFVFTCFLFETSVAQDGSHKIDLPSPTSSSIAEVAETPVNLFNGHASIDVPIYTVKKNNLSLPISLSYSTTGVRVQDIADWVGLGWRLNAGGAITRVMRGNPDEWSTGYLNTGDDPDFANFLSLSSSAQYSLLKYELKSSIDPEPDVFYYSIPGYSGKFLIGPDGEAYSISQNNLKISYTSIGAGSFGEFNGFEIVTPDGTIYEFTKKEWVVQAGGSITTGDYVSAWYLTKIESAIGDAEITLDYNTTTIEVTHESPLFEAEYDVLTSGAPSDVYQTGYSKFERVYLEEIHTDHESIDFTSRSLRDDAVHPASSVKQEYKLDQISVVNASTSTTIREVDFTYSYHSDRLFLDEVQAKGLNSEVSPPYKFEYISRGGLPDRLSFAVDHWGYYNGKTGNSSYIAETIFRHSVLDDKYYSGADRSTNPTTIAYGTLNKVTYPTGGHTLLEYEPHDYGSIQYPIGADLTELETTSNNYFSTSIGSPETFYFTVDNDVEATSLVEIQVRFVVVGTSNRYVKIIDDSNGSTLRHYTPSSSGFPETINDHLLVADGTYRVELKRDDMDDLVTSDIDFYEDKIVDKKIGGGIRIKKITRHDGIHSDNDIVKTFEYSTSIPGEESFGVLSTEPDYDYIFASGDQGTAASGSLNFYARVSSPIAPFGGEGRKFVGYEKVIEKESQTGGYGSSISEFTVTPSYRTSVNLLFDDWDHGAFIAQPDFSYRYGQLKKKTVKDEGGSILNEVNRTYFSYDEAPLDEDKSYKEFPAIAYYEFSGNDFKYRYYNMYAVWRKNVSEEIKIYEGEVSPITKSTTFVYSSDQHKLLTSKVETNSDGEERETVYEYAHEEYAGMAGLHMLSQPYSVSIKDGSGVLRSKRWTLWNTFGGNWHPCGVWVWTGGAATAPANCSSN